MKGLSRSPILLHSGRVLKRGSLLSPEVRRVAGLRGESGSKR